jgi:hypothetical protein
LHAGGATATQAFGFGIADAEREAEHQCCGHQSKIFHVCLRVEKITTRSLTLSVFPEKRY